MHSYHSDKDADDLRAFLTGDLPSRPENELVDVVARLCEIVGRLEAKVEDMERTLSSLSGLHP